MLPILFTILSYCQVPPPVPRVGRNRHLAYEEAPSGTLVTVEGMLVRKNAREPLSRLLEAARKDGIHMRTATAFRSVEEQRRLFEAGAKKKNISQKSYGWWTAPPGFSEHHTGLAVDFVEVGNSKADFTPELFRKTAAFAWLKVRASQFGFELSFPENNGLRVAFEPWHWRYVGDEAARAIFAVARAGRVAQDGSTIGNAPPS